MMFFSNLVGLHYNFPSPEDLLIYDTRLMTTMGLNLDCAVQGTPTDLVLKASLEHLGW